MTARGLDRQRHAFGTVRADLGAKRAPHARFSAICSKRVGVQASPWGVRAGRVEATRSGIDR